MLFFTPYTKRKRQPSARGFTLVELMVSVGIIVLVTGLALVRYGAFNNSVLLKSQALELALDIRQAQASSVSVSVGSEVALNEREGYGVYVNTDTDNGANGQYILFRDNDNDSRYDDGEQVGETYIIDPRFVISDICDQNGACDYTDAAVSFRRPNFDARLRADGTAVTQLDIVLATVQEDSVTRTISVYASGQITVE